MGSFITKLRLIFIPFLQIAIGTICVYTFLNWLLFIRCSVFTVDDEILNVFAPFIAPGIPLLIWLRPRIKLLDLKSKNGRADPLTGYIMLAWLAIGIPTAIAQSYLVTATGKLTYLDNIGQISNYPKTKYYTAKQFFINKRLFHANTTFTVSNKGSDFDMAIFVAVPVFDHLFPDTNIIASMRNRANPNTLVILNGKISTMDSLKKLPADSISMMRYVNPSFVMPKYGDAGKYGALAAVTRGYKITWKTPQLMISPSAWLAVKYSKTIGNHLAGPKKDSAYRAFAMQTATKFDTTHFDKFTYLTQVPNSWDLKNYKIAVDRKGDVENNNHILLEPVFEPFEARNGNKLPWIFGSLAIGSVAFMITLLFKPLRDSPLMVGDDGSPEKEESEWTWLSVFVPRPGYYITPIIIDLNLFVFIVMVFAGLGFISFDAQDLLRWGANYRPSVLRGEYWRLFTSTFLHGGVMHVLFNMYGLMFVGIFLEPLLGSKKFAVTYLVTGLLASVASVWWHPATVGVGASGAIFGMYGIFLALLTTNLFPSDFKKSFLLSTSIFVGYNLLFGLTGGIDNAAHIGGLSSGLVIGYALYPSLKSKAREAEAQAET